MKPKRPAPYEMSSQAPAALPVDKKGFFFLHGVLLLYSVASVFAKYAGLYRLAGLPAQTLLFVGLEFLALLVYTLLWQLVLRKAPLSFAYSNKAVCTLWTILLGLVFFGEALTWGKAIGSLVTLAGVALVVTDHDV